MWIGPADWNVLIDLLGLICLTGLIELDDCCDWLALTGWIDCANSADPTGRINVDGVAFIVSIEWNDWATWADWTGCTDLICWTVRVCACCADCRDLNALDNLNDLRGCTDLADLVDVRDLIDLIDFTE